jgi:hypothetical protein
MSFEQLRRVASIIETLSLEHVSGQQSSEGLVDDVVEQALADDVIDSPTESTTSQNIASVQHPTSFNNDDIVDSPPESNISHANLEVEGNQDEEGYRIIHSTDTSLDEHPGLIGSTGINGILLPEFVQSPRSDDTIDNIHNENNSDPSISDADNALNPSDDNSIITPSDGNNLLASTCDNVEDVISIITLRNKRKYGLKSAKASHKPKKIREKYITYIN